MTCDMKALAREFAGIPQRRPKPVHLAKLVREDGKVSPVCAPKPRAIDLRRAVWTLRREANTCTKCLKKMEDS